ncbi:MAG: hypothetical protein C0602_05350 [Denitrovibrio sp.]|nr:MAG: hypothetical protein C0602_05350 [Denitrovibrio sp.]
MRLIPAIFLVTLAFANVSCAKVADVFIDKSKVDNWYVKASLYQQDGNLEEASKMLEVVLEAVSDEYIYFKLANIYRKLLDKEMTIFTLQRGIKELPESYKLLGSLAVEYRDNIETVEEALELYQRAYELSGDPKYAEGKAITYAAMRDFNNAIKVFDMLIEKEEKGDYYLNRGRYYDKLGLEQESIADYSKAVEIDDNFMAAARLADYYVEKGKNKQAIKYLKIIIRESPSLTIAKFRLAEILLKIGKTDEAEDYFSEILDVLNESEKLYVLKQLASIAFTDKKYEKAEEYFEKAYEISEDIKVAYSLALLAERSDNFELAKDWYRRVLEKRPDFAEASKRLAILELRDKNYDEALNVLAGVEELSQDIDFFRIKSQAYVSKDMLSEAAELLAPVVKDNPNEQRLYLDLALIYDKLKQKDNAIELIKKALELFPDEPSFQNFLGYMYAEQGIKLEEAEKLISAALEKKPNEPAYLDSLAWVYYQKGLYEKALPLQTKALKGAPEEQEIIDHMKAILEKLGIKKSIDEILQDK